MFAVVQSTSCVDAPLCKLDLRGGRNLWQKLRARTFNLEGRSVARAPPYVALNVCCVNVQTLPVMRGLMFAGIGSIVAGRGSMVAVRGSRFVGGGSRVAVRDLGAQTPHYLRAERLLRRRSGDMARLPYHNDWG